MHQAMEQIVFEIQYHDGHNPYDGEIPGKIMKQKPTVYLEAISARPAPIKGVNHAPMMVLMKWSEALHTQREPIPYVGMRTG